MAPAHSRRRDLRLSCRRRDTAATDDFSDLAELVTAAAARLARELNDSAVDHDDIEQELWIRLYRGMPGHDPALGDRLRFAKMLFKRHRVTLIRARYAEKRPSLYSNHSVARTAKPDSNRPSPATAAWPSLVRSAAPKLITPICGSTCRP